jgi:hypothetical protein
MYTITLKGIKAAVIGAIGMALIGFALFLIFGPGGNRICQLYPEQARPES